MFVFVKFKSERETEFNCIELPNNEVISWRTLRHKIEIMYNLKSKQRRNNNKKLKRDESFVNGKIKDRIGYKLLSMDDVIEDKSCIVLIRSPSDIPGIYPGMSKHTENHIKNTQNTPRKVLKSSKILVIGTEGNRYWIKTKTNL